MCRCAHPDCKTRASFGLAGQRASHCATHKLEGMENVNV